MDFEEGERGRASPWRQLSALLKKNVKERARRPVAASCELCSSLLFMVVLVLGFNLSKIIVVDEAIYSSVSLSVPGRLKKILAVEDVERLGNVTTGSGDAGSGEYDVNDAGDITHFFKKLMEGPFPVPGFDAFVELGSLISANLDFGSYEYLLTNNEAGRDFGNLLTLGTLHFAPESHPAVPAMVDWFNRTYPEAFERVPRRLHESEAAAVDYVLDTLGERAWAVIAVGQAERGDVSYTLRMNFTTVPDTHYAVDDISIGLDSRFKRYYLSGYLTLQRCIDRFMFEFTAGDSQGGGSAGPARHLADPGGGTGGGNTPPANGEDICIPPRVLPMPMPTPGYHQNLFYVAVGFLLGLALTMSTMYPVSRLVKGVVEEKETRMTETLITMGLRPWVHALSWWLTGVAVFGWIGVSTATLVSLTFLPRSDPSLLLTFFLLFSLSEVNFGLLLSTFFSKAKLSAIVAPVCLFAAVLPRYVFYTTTKYEAASLKYWCSLLAPTAFAFGADAISSYEYVGVGARWSNCTQGDFSLASSMMMMALDCVLYAVLALYLGQTWPREHGSPKHPLFCLPGVPALLSRRRGLQEGRHAGLAARAEALFRRGRGWAPLGSRDDDGEPLPAAVAVTAVSSALSAPVTAVSPPVTAVTAVSGAVSAAAADETGVSAVGDARGDRRLPPPPLAEGDVERGAAAESGGAAEGMVTSASALAAATAVPEDFEPAAKELRGRVQLMGLRKQYPGKLAVAGVDLTLYEGQISCLLGHNGAGKTTVVSMLTGLTPPTGGDCLVWGSSVRDDLAVVRSDMGVCQQHTVLFPLLTVREHLELMADLKGVDPSRREAAVLEKAREVGLTDKLGTLSDALSGGMKRKLQVAMAFMGSPRLVLLDEPTSGMDPCSRRALWELLRRSRQGRVILLTTHYLDEADILGDRVAIMSRGRLRCAGSTLFLKSRFGLGYNLTLVRAAGTAAGAAFHAPTLIQLVKGCVPAAELLSAAGGEAVFRLPLRESPRFPALFRRVEAERAALGIGAFGVSVTSLEEVFLSLETAAETAIERGETDAGVAVPPSLPAAPLSPLLAAAGSSGHGYGSVTPPAARNGHAGDGSATGVANDSAAIAKGGREGGGIELRELPPHPQRGGGKGGKAGDISEDSANNSPPPRRGVTSAGVTIVTAGGGAEKLRFRGSSKSASAPSFRRVAFWAQVRELLRKRRIVASRDPKGEFFQLGLPALVVLLVLAMLSIELDISGPAMRMDPTMYREEGGGPGGITEVLFDGPAASTVPYPGLEDEGVVWTEARGGAAAAGYPYGPDSTGLSRHLLDTIHSPGRLPRFGAFVFGDRLPIDLKVDWPWVTTHYGEVVRLLAAARGSGGDGIIGVGEESIDVDDIITQALRQDGGLVRAALAAHLGDVAGWIGLPAATADDEPALQLLGIDEETAKTGLESLGLGESAADAAADALAGLTAGDTGADAGRAFLNLTGLDPSALSGGGASDFGLSFERARLNITALVVTIEGASVTSNNASYPLGDIVLPLEDAAKALPRTKSEYADLPWNVPPEAAYTLLHNTTSIHALPAWISELTRLQYRVCTGMDEASYVHYNHPLPLTAQQSLEVQTVLSLFASLFILIPLCYAPAAFVVFVVKERQCKSKHVQLASGASPAAYWVSTFMFDAGLFWLLSLLLAGCFWAFDDSSARVFAYDADAATATYLLMLLYGFSCLPLCYLYTFFFDNHSTAQISIMGINFVSGFGFVLAYFILISIDRTRALGKALVHVFRLFPPYLVGEGLINVSTSFYKRHVVLLNVDMMSWEVSGRSLAYMSLQAAGYFFLTLVIEATAVSPAGGPIEACRRLAARRRGGSGGGGAGAGNSFGGGGGGGWRAAAAAALEGDDVDVARERAEVAKAAAAAVSAVSGQQRYETVETAETAESLRTAAETAPEDGEARDYLVLINEVHKVYPPPLLELLASWGDRCRGLWSAAVGAGGGGGGGGGRRQRRPVGKAAVRGVSLGVKAGECFGLLGVNGAGKTSLLSVLTCDIRPSSGEVLIGGRRPEAGGLGRLVGYCPQVDPLLELMTAAETLRFYGALKGLPRGAPLETAVADTLRRVGLSEHAHRPAGTYSGGNKRKLSLAVALIGDPPVLLLDEPSTGMDPGARRSMWDVIARVAEDRSVIITTHSLEECEALCTRVGIMAAGRLRCLGSSQHLKARFGSGYSLELRAAESSMDEVDDLVKSISPVAVLQERHATLARYSLPPAGSPGAASLSEVFAAVEARRELVYDYGISQATLESVFVGLAKRHEQGAGAGAAEDIAAGRSLSPLRAGSGADHRGSGLGRRGSGGSNAYGGGSGGSSRGISPLQRGGGSDFDRRGSSGRRRGSGGGGGGVGVGGGGGSGTASNGGGGGAAAGQDAADAAAGGRGRNSVREGEAVPLVL